MKLTTYEDWKHFITVSCGIPLTSEYIQERIKDLNNSTDYGTRKLIETWGEDHCKKVIAWFEKARSEI